MLGVRGVTSATGGLRGTLVLAELMELVEVAEAGLLALALPGRMSTAVLVVLVQLGAAELVGAGLSSECIVALELLFMGMVAVLVAELVAVLHKGIVEGGWFLRAAAQEIQEDRGFMVVVLGRQAPQDYWSL